MNNKESSDSKKSKKDRDRSRSRQKNHKKRKRSTSSPKSRSRSRTKSIPRTEKRKSRWSNGPERESNFSSAPEKIEILDTNDVITINEKLKQINPLLGITSRDSQFNTSHSGNISYTLNDSSKIKRKIFIPKMTGVNFVGLLIGPKGTYQKRLEQQSGCKILIRGKGTQKDGTPLQPDDEEEQHALIVGETDENVNKAQFLIEKVLFSDNETRNKIKEEQLKASQEMRSELFFTTDSTGKPIPQQIDDSLMTPYGPPDKNARIVPVPNDCVGLIIGKNGETIRRLHRETGCKIQIAKKEIPNTEVRNVFIEGPQEKYEIARKLIEDIVAEQQTLKQNISQLGEVNPFPGPYERIKVPNNLVGLIIGKNGETVKNLHQKTGSYIFIPKDSKNGEDFRTLELSGSSENVAECKNQIEKLISAINNPLPNEIQNEHNKNQINHSEEAFKPGFSISSQTMSQILNPQTNTLVTNFTRPNLPMPPTIPHKIPQNYPEVSNINYSQNIHNFAGFTPYMQPYNMPYIHPLNNPYCYPMINQPTNLLMNNIGQIQNNVFPAFRYQNINPYHIPFSQVYNTPSNPSYVNINTNYINNYSSNPHSIPATNPVTKVEKSVKVENKIDEFLQNKPVLNKNLSEITIPENKINNLAKCEPNNQNEQKIEENINPTLAYIYGGQFFNNRKKDKEG